MQRGQPTGTTIEFDADGTAKTLLSKKAVLDPSDRFRTGRYRVSGDTLQVTAAVIPGAGADSVAERIAIHRWKVHHTAGSPPSPPQTIDVGVSAQGPYLVLDPRLGSSEILLSRAK